MTPNPFPETAFIWACFACRKVELRLDTNRDLDWCSKCGSLSGTFYICTRILETPQSWLRRQAILEGECTSCEVLESQAGGEVER